MRDDPLGRIVEWFYGTDWKRENAAGRGRVIGYSDSPQVLIETDNGEKVWWRADLTLDVTCEHCGGTGIRRKS
jgi:hypothetical protein